MTGFDLYKSICSLKGETYMGTQTPDNAVLDMINEIGGDLCGMKPVKAFKEELPIEEKIHYALACGVAMLLAVRERNAADYNAFSTLYDMKRSALKSANSSVSDVLPVAVDSV